MGADWPPEDRDGRGTSIIMWTVSKTAAAASLTVARSPDVIIVGAGHSGLVAAIILAARLQP
jgi:ribulose 1,5-bisphosphate synthetase/thiazole synthase